MATPHVAGLASLLMGHRPGLTPALVSQYLQITARSFPAGSGCTTSTCGAGIVDAYNVLTYNPGPMNEKVYLPIMLRVEPLPPPPPPATFVNPDFELGPTGWEQFSSNAFPLILNDFSPTGVTAHSGVWAVWLGGGDNEVGYIGQQVTVPAGAPYLAYWHWIGSQDVCGFDYGGVIINNSIVVDVYTLCESANTGGWVKHVVDLSPYAGQSVHVRIQIETDDSLNSNLFIDDVSFQATPSTAGSAPGLISPANAVPRLNE